MFDKFESQQFDSLQALIDSITPEIHENLKTAVEIGRWANGDKLTPEQLEHSLQAIIAYEARHLSEEQRIGFIDTSGLKKSACDAPDPLLDSARHDDHHSSCGSEPARDASLIASTRDHLH